MLIPLGPYMSEKKGKLAWEAVWDNIATPILKSAPRPVSTARSVAATIPSRAGIRRDILVFGEKGNYYRSKLIDEFLVRRLGTHLFSPSARVNKTMHYAYDAYLPPHTF